ncbi:MAG: cardiolipin synthase [Microbacteriaceae bacterium]|nr:cardiolipin synthase [Microbacteriaceae bacterium]
MIEEEPTGTPDIVIDLPDWVYWTYLGFTIALRVLAVFIVPRNRRPQTATAWLLAIMFIPEIGWLLFLLFGSHRVGKRRRERQAEVNRFIAQTTHGVEFVEHREDWPDWLEPIADLNRRLGAMPLVGGSTGADFYPDYDTSIAAMTKAIREAQRTVHAEFYIFGLDDTTQPFFEAMADAVRRGVTVRVLLDHVANLRLPVFRKTKRFFIEHGIIWQLMLPLQPLKGRWQRPDLRNHRKLLVIDGAIAFTGSQNVIDSTYNKSANIRRGLHWKDLMVRFEGPIVGGIDALFITDWYSETGEALFHEVGEAQPQTGEELIDAQVVPSGPGFDGENNLRLFNALVYAARQRLIITSPYFVPDDSMLYAITTAAQKGLDVQLFVSEIGDQAMVFHAQRSYYETLLRAGVRIWLYSAPTILHAKHLTVDDDVAVVGSSNMDMRSFTLNYEISVMVRSRDFVRRMRTVEDAYRARSRELTLQEWTRRPTRTKLLDNIARLTAGLQ